MADRRLKVFHTVAKLLNFTKAADALHMTQPAVTFQIRQLEEYFNTRLFDRTHNRVSLTEAGQRVYGFSDKIFELYDEMEIGHGMNRRYSELVPPKVRLLGYLEDDGKSCL